MESEEGCISGAVSDIILGRNCSYVEFLWVVPSALPGNVTPHRFYPVTKVFVYRVKLIDFYPVIYKRFYPVTADFYPVERVFTR